MDDQGEVIVAGPQGPLSMAVMQRLAEDGLRALSSSTSVPLPVNAAPTALVVIPASHASVCAGSVSLPEFAAELEQALAGTARLAKVLGTRTKLQSGRIVLVADWAVSGLADNTAASAVGGLMLGLARSWALELAPANVTVNAVVVGPQAEVGGARPTYADVAHAVSFFLDSRSSFISGQILSVCGGRTPGLLPF